MKIVNGTVFRQDSRFAEQSVTITGGRFSFNNESASGKETIDASGCYVIPGMIDIHFHGCMGDDFCDGTEKAVETLARYEASQGITAICPATLTLPAAELKHILSVGAAYARKPHLPAEADLVGINMEGPFISYEKRGAQNPDYIIRADVQTVDEFLEASEGLVKMIGLAPEENEGFEQYITEVKDKVRVSLAHTNASYEEAKRALDAGACHAVHLYNAMSTLSHRNPGVVGAVSDSPHTFCEIICDGIHVHPSAVRAAFRMMGSARMVLISDSLRAAGMGDGIIDLGGQQVEVHGPKATLVKEGSIAGSVTNLADCLRIAVKEMGIPLEEAVAAATINPARAIGIAKEYGSISAGKRGNVVLLRKEDLSTVLVIKDGTVIADYR